MRGGQVFGSMCGQAPRGRHDSWPHVGEHRSKCTRDAHQSNWGDRRCTIPSLISGSPRQSVRRGTYHGFRATTWGTEKQLHGSKGDGRPPPNHTRRRTFVVRRELAIGGSGAHICFLRVWSQTNILVHSSKLRSCRLQTITHFLRFDYCICAVVEMLQLDNLRDRFNR